MGHASHAWGNLNRSTQTALSAVMSSRVLRLPVASCRHGLASGDLWSIIIVNTLRWLYWTFPKFHKQLSLNLANCQMKKESRWAYMFASFYIIKKNTIYCDMLLQSIACMFQAAECFPQRPRPQVPEAIWCLTRSRPFGMDLGQQDWPPQNGWGFNV